MKSERNNSGSTFRILTAMFAVCLAVALLAGCSAGKPADETGTGTSPATEAATESAAPSDFPDVEVGETFKLGKYEQNGVEEDGAEDIEWVVLSKEDGKLLAVSKYSLDSMEFNNADEGTTWENSTIRAWLNGEFYDGAFAESEKKIISDSGEGCVFLLSVDEAKTLFETDEDRVSEGTEYAYSVGLFKTTGGGVWWWLRTECEKPGFIAGVDGNGLVSESGNTAHRIKHGIRPAILLAP